jgi:hypothetical protein
MTAADIQTMSHALISGACVALLIALAIPAALALLKGL